MSGGSLDYAYLRVLNIASLIRGSSDRPLHLALAQHLHKVADALKALEWTLSCDNEPGSEDEAIRKLIDRSDEVDAARAAAEKALKDLKEALGVSE